MINERLYIIELRVTKRLRSRGYRHINITLRGYAKTFNDARRKAEWVARKRGYTNVKCVNKYQRVEVMMKQ